MTLSIFNPREVLTPGTTATCSMVYYLGMSGLATLRRLTRTQHSVSQLVFKCFCWNYGVSCCRRRQPKASTRHSEFGYVMSQRGADGETKQSLFMVDHRLLRAMNFEFWFVQIRCDQTQTSQFGAFEFMRLLKPAVSCNRTRRTMHTGQMQTRGIGKLVYRLQSSEL